LDIEKNVKEKDGLFLDDLAEKQYKQIMQ